MVFSALSIPYRRSTRDLDFQGMLDNDKDSLTQVIKQICDVEVEYDGVEFDLSSIMATEIRLEANYPGIRFKFLGYLGKSRINMVVDVSFGGSIVPDVLVLDFPTLLDSPTFQN